MNDQKIYEYIARKPGSRAQDIADALDVELTVASSELRSLVDMGDLERYTGTGPNGLSAQLYKLSDDFARTAKGAAIVEAAARYNAARAEAAALVPAAAAAAPPAAAPPPFATPVFAKQEVIKPSRTKIEMAIEHLKLHPGASDDEMRTVMALQKSHSPRSYLNVAVKDGRVRKVNDGWVLGEGVPPPKKARKPFRISSKGPKAQFSKTAEPAGADNVAQGGNVVPSTRDQTPVPPAALAAVGEGAESGSLAAFEQMMAERAQSLAGPGVFRCGLWSDGVLELQRDGNEVARLTRGEGEQLAEFMTRMLGAAQVAA